MAEHGVVWCGWLWQEYSKTLAAALYASLKEVRLSPVLRVDPAYPHRVPAHSSPFSSIIQSPSCSCSSHASAPYVRPFSPIPPPALCAAPPSQVDQAFLQEKLAEAAGRGEEEMNFSGSTAMIALFDGRSRLLCASLGDCRAVLSRKGMAVGVSAPEHKANRKDEIARVVKRGVRARGEGAVGRERMLMS